MPRKSHELSAAAWRWYERKVAASEAVTRLSDAVAVTPNAHIRGAISGINRQVDVLADSRVVDGVDRRVIVDAKLRRRKIDVMDVEQFEGMMRDCRARSGVLVCSAGYTAAASRRAEDAIRLTLVTPEELDESDFEHWHPCLGHCATAGSRRRRPGYVLYNQPFGLFIANEPLIVVTVGKCDACADFHVWCDECGRQFALRGDEAEGGCGCDRLFFTAGEPETNSDGKEEDNASVYVLMVSVKRPNCIIYVDRRPLR